MTNIEKTANDLAVCAVQGIECHLDFDSPETAKKVFDRAKEIIAGLIKVGVIDVNRPLVTTPQSRTIN